MPEFHSALADQARRVIEHGLDISHDADLVPLSHDVIDGDLAVALFAHGESLEWAVFEYDTDWFLLGNTSITTTDPPPAGERAGLEVRFDTWGRSRTRRWSLRGHHLVHTRVLRAQRIAQLRVATRTVAAPHGWAIMVWRGRRAPAVSVDRP
ncbi:hypothetical protein [Nonomuraea sp. NPDC049709]|uniref:hypothetical protein n=1 Tax=Nonomuraea sp. NPDC049709 TaxID=3154736 RepID=UPI0034496DBC